MTWKSAKRFECSVTNTYRTQSPVSKFTQTHISKEIKSEISVHYLMKLFVCMPWNWENTAYGKLKILSRSKEQLLSSSLPTTTSSSLTHVHTWTSIYSSAILVFQYKILSLSPLCPASSRSCGFIVRVLHCWADCVIFTLKVSKLK